MNQTLRSLIFNIAFYSYTVVWCFLLMWAFALPRAWALRSVMIYFNGITWIERIFMKLDYHVEGWEHLPETGSYILAMKHQSAYETLKLLPLFGDIAVVLKRELTWIPFWGWYTIKVGMIPVDRGARGRAMASMMAGARRVVAQGRPIVIFPQGTRVAVDATPADKPYKFGVAKLAEALQIPIVPVALNSGVFWGRKAFTKRSGVIDFKILPPIMPGQPAQEVMSQLETALETESDALAANAKIDHPVKPATPGWLRWVLIALIVVFALWGAWWYTLAGMIEKQITMRLAAQDGPTQISSPYTPVIEGFPGAIVVTWPQVHVVSPSSTVDIGALEARIWPLPAAPASVHIAGGIRIAIPARPQVLEFDTAAFEIRLPRPWQPTDEWSVVLKSASFGKGNALVEAKGDIIVPFNNQLPLEGQMNALMSGYRDLVNYAADQDLIDDQAAGLTKGFMDAMAITQGTPGTLVVPVQVRDNWVYVGPIRAFSLRPEAELQPAAGSASTLQRIHPSGSGSSSTLDLNPQIVP